ncbi:MAG: glycine--tRNA ligase subunit beta [Acidobacteriota bacterium]|nr:glycine--tRNA ligase subunit beta [Acidobacteriota bacterium]MDH3524574.1 glycine--tRNA ligase subunit beta [Acidobacteriota bacterium]
MARGELLLEVRSEEIPARMLRPALSQLEGDVRSGLEAAGLAPRRLAGYFGPRRLCLVVTGIPAAQADETAREVGPPASAAFDASGRPTAAALGFAKRCGVDAAALRRVTLDKGDYVVVEIEKKGRSAAAILAAVLPAAIAGLDWPKTMRWGAGIGPWVRPILGIVALFDGEVVPFELFGVASGRATVAHPILAPRPFEVRGAADYRRKLARRHVVVDFEARRNRLAAGIRETASAMGGLVGEDSELLDKLTSICEIPGVVGGSFDVDYLALPSEVLTASLRDHQSAFTLQSGQALLPGFVTVMDRPDDPEGKVRAGNEWVVDARLSDARFFFREDRKRSLEEHAARLPALTFHVKLGSYAEKSQRIRQLVQMLCDELGWSEEREDAVTAAGLLKADLTTEMVKEFTSLQGVIGGIYAREDGAREDVWQAIYGQYLPVAASDPIPRGRVGVVCGIADRVDTLVGIFGLGLMPTGSRDPFGLRRAAQGLVRIVLEADLPLDLDLVAARAVLLYGDRLERGGEEVLSHLRPFLENRVRHILGLEGFAYDEIEAGLAVGFGNLPDLRARVRALHGRREDRGFLAVVLAAKRIANILKDTREHVFREELLREEAERRLFQASRDLRAEVESAEGKGAYDECLRSIARFADVLERFFVEVLVMDENRDLRQNRIALLQSIQRTLSRTARLTEMVVDRAELRKE